jgi:hypothetical protein
VIEPLEETTQWWQEMVSFYCYDLSDEEERQELDQIFDCWRSRFQWFNTHEDLHGCAYIKIGLGRFEPDYIGSILPRLVVGVTRLGSVVGVCGCMML